MLIKVGRSYFNTDHIKRAVDASLPVVDHNGVPDRHAEPRPVLSLYFMNEAAPSVFRGEDRIECLRQLEDVATCDRNEMVLEGFDFMNMVRHQLNQSAESHATEQEIIDGTSQEERE
jgi:hypothetical protein